jgi:serine/threonine kinase 16
MSDYGPLAIVSDVVYGTYSWLVSLCCAVECATGSKSFTVGDRQLRSVRLLAEGGFSFVWLVEEKCGMDYGNKFALKRVLAQSPEQSEAARWEVEVHSAFRHPNCMPLIDHAVVPMASGAGEEFLMLMPLYPSGSLLDRTEQHRKEGSRMPERTILKIFAKILEAVAQFHEHDPPWAHRDIKPANVLLDGDEPILMDFGSTKPARVKIKSRTEALLMQEDAAQNCSMPYRAPELFDLPSDATIDERTDVFSLGATLYAMGCVAAAQPPRDRHDAPAQYGRYYFSPFECTFHGNAQTVVECSHLRVIAPAQVRESTGTAPPPHWPA